MKCGVEGGWNIRRYPRISVHLGTARYHESVDVGLARTALSVILEVLLFAYIDGERD